MGVITGDLKDRILKVPSIVLPNEHWFVRLVMKLPTFMFAIEHARIGRHTDTHSRIWLWRRKGLKTRIMLIKWMIAGGVPKWRAILNGLFN